MHTTILCTYRRPSWAGSARIYDTADFSLVAEFTLGGGNGSALVNDVIVTDTAAFFTDSWQAQLYKVGIRGARASHSSMSNAL